MIVKEKIKIKRKENVRYHFDDDTKGPKETNCAALFSYLL